MITLSLLGLIILTGLITCFKCTFICEDRHHCGLGANETCDRCYAFYLVFGLTIIISVCIFLDFVR